MTHLYISLSYTSLYFQRYRHYLIHQRGILWSKHSCWVPYYEWKDVFQTLIPVELHYERLKQLQRDNATNFKAIYSIYNGPLPISKKRLDMSWIGPLLITLILFASLYYRFEYMHHL